MRIASRGPNEKEMSSRAEEQGLVWICKVGVIARRLDDRVHKKGSLQRRPCFSYSHRRVCACGELPRKAEHD